MATTRKKAVRKSAHKTAARKPRKPAPARPRAGPGKRAPARRSAPKGANARASGTVLKLAGVGTEAVAKATGKAWDQWLAILDKAGAAAMPHRAIAALLAVKHRVPAWWSQMVAVGYEQARGLRKAHQKADGFSASASRTVQASLDRLYAAWSDPALRALWMGPAPIEVTRSTGGKSMRIRWTAGGSRVDVNFYPAGGGRSRVQVEHGKLADERARAAQKAFWGGALGRLKSMLEKAA
jgi:uncharacterized protein YndB with AHSA1/START domain